MNIIIKREKLLPLIQAVVGVVERRQSLPVLSNLLVMLAKGEIRLTATDMEVELVSITKLAESRDAEFTLPAKKILDICRALPAEADINISFDGDRAQILSGKSRFTLAKVPVQEYPIIEMQDTVAEFSITESAFKDLLEKTAFAMAQQDVRYYLNGLLLEVESDKIRAVATDGHRLALHDIEGKTGVESTAQIIVPRKGVMELVRLLEGGEDELKVQLSHNHIRIVLSDLVFTSKLIDGKFPDYDRVIPEPGDTPIFADRELLRQSLTRASILSNEKNKGVRIQLTKGKLNALAHNPEQEEAEEEVEVDYQGQEIEIGFNVSYLLDALNVIKTKQVKINIQDPNSSCLLSSDKDATSKYVIMPMRL